jgi:hypothetical protein
MTTLTAKVDSVAFFDRLADAMAADAERYERLGDIEVVLALVMRRPAGDPFRLRISFHGIACDGVAEIAPGDEIAADCWLEGGLEDWQAMFDNIVEHGHAVDQWTLNTLTLFGDRISLHATDPMGEDRFHRFNQTLQDFVDAAARLDASA